MRFGIVGLPLVGKSTIFHMLTGGNSDTSHAGHWEGARTGVAHVRDHRLDRLAEVLKPTKVSHSTVEFVDIPGIERRGKGKAIETDPRSWPSYLSSLRTVDALMHVVRAFRDDAVPHSEGGVDPGRDISLFELEMIFSDLAVIEKRMDRLSSDLRKMKSAELELEYEVLRRYGQALEEERALRDIDLTDEEGRLMRGFTFLTAKPLLIALNLDDGEAPNLARAAGEHGLTEHGARRKCGLTAVCGKIESEIAALPDEDAALFTDDLGLTESGPARVIRAAYQLLDLITFYTVSENEGRSWAVPRDTPALRAAGGIHSDFERGFIKAEVVSYSDMLAAGSFTVARSKGVLRVEGKDYPVRDGDVVLFRFHV